MIDWTSVARAATPEIPSEQVERLRPALDALEAGFRPLIDRIPLPTEPAFVLAPFLRGKA